MSSFKLYHYINCPFCKPIYYFVNETKLPHEEIHLDLAKKEQRTPEYLSINPFGKVPAIIEQDGFILFESSTVLRYLCNTRDVPDNWYSKDPKKRSQVDLFFDWYQVNVKSFAKYYFTKYPELGYPVDQPENAQSDLEKALDDIQKIFLRNRKYLAGDEISLADIQIIFFFAFLELAGFDVSRFAPIKEWKERVLFTGIKKNYEDYLGAMRQKLEDAKANAQNK